MKENPVYSDAPDSDQEVQDMKGKVKELRTQILHLEKEKQEALDHLHKNEAELEVFRKNLKSSGTATKVEEFSELEEEIEDLKDEISDFEKKIRHFREEKNEMESKISSLEREFDQALEVLKKNDEQLKEAELQIAKQRGSLDFVSELLNANNATNEEYQEIDHKTWGILHFIENELSLDLSSLNNNFIDDDFREKCWDWRNHEIKSWIKNKKVVAVVGEFSAGKTSIVNKILKQDDPDAVELPVRSKETTAIPTYISKGKDFNCQFYSPSGDLKNISSASFQKVTKSVLNDINISSIVKYFVLSYKNENLSNLSILDTPGFGSNSKEIVGKTTEVIKEADALFWVIDAHTGEINTSSIEVIKNNLQGLPLYIIINKADKKSKADLEELKVKIERTLQNNNITYQQVTAFSNKMNADVLISILNKIPPKDNYDVISELQNQISTTIRDAKNQLEQLKTEEFDLQRNVDNQKNNLEELMSCIDHSVQDMERVIEFESSFFGKDYYKMSLQNHNKFVTYRSEILTANDVLPDSMNNFIDILDSHSDIKDEVRTIKSNIRNLEASKRAFENLLQEYEQLQLQRIPEKSILT